MSFVLRENRLTLCLFASSEGEESFRVCDKICDEVSL